jgi:hypothetical protein
MSLGYVMLEHAVQTMITWYLRNVHNVLGMLKFKVCLQEYSRSNIYCILFGKTKLPNQ